MYNVESKIQMVALCLVCLFISSVMLASEMCGQAQTASSNIYSTLQGGWIGFDDYLQAGQLKHVPVEIFIALEKDGKTLRMDYTCAKKGDPSFTRYTKYMFIDTKTETVSFRWKHESADVYKMDNSESFEQKGLSKVTAIGPAPGPHAPGDGSIGRFTLECRPDILNYSWESKAEGGNFQVVSSYSLHRSASASATP